MDNSKKSFLFYDSFLDSIEVAPEDEQLSIIKDLLNVCLKRKSIDEVPYPNNMLITQCLYSVTEAKRRYDASVELGKKGGRPSKWVDREEAEKLFDELGKWNLVADALDVDEKTLRKARFAWNAEREKREKRKNHNDNDNDNDNVNVNDNYQLTKLKEKNKKEKSGVGVVPFIGDSSTAGKETDIVKWKKKKNADGDWVMVPVKDGDES